MTPERESTRAILVREQGSGALYKRGSNNESMMSCCATFPTGSDSGSNHTFTESQSVSHPELVVHSSREILFQCPYFVVCWISLTHTPQTTAGIIEASNGCIFQPFDF